MSQPSCSEEHPDIIECRRILSLVQPDRLKQYKSRNDIDNVLRQLRILARSKNLDNCFDLNSIEILVSLAKDRHKEALMCLHNIILNHSAPREYFIEPYIDCFNSRQFIDCSQDILIFDLKILFLLSALHPNSRRIIFDKTYDNLIILINQVDFSNLNSHDLLCEILKVLFNITITQVPPEVPLFGLLIDMLSYFDSQTNQGVFVHAVNLLTNLPHEIYHQFTQEISDKLFANLDSKLSICDNHIIRESLMPILTCCINMCKSNSIIRRHWKNKVLTKNTNYTRRPELDDSARGNLVRLMTSVDTEVKDAAAWLIFILCKENVNRFIKYTGFGNAAGFLANQGLMNTEKIKTIDKNPAYSSESDSSDSEEHISNENKINLVTGAYQARKQNPMDGMSEEEKEHHAVELVRLISKMSTGGIIKPMGVGKDGKIQEISSNTCNYIKKKQETDDRVD